MKKNILSLCILFVLLACGVQNNPPTNNASEDESELDNLSLPATAIVTLPTAISIDFPNILSNSSNDIFNQKIKYIIELINVEKYYLKLLHQVMSEIEEKCVKLETCTIEANYFKIEENLFLGEINFNKSLKSLNNNYELILAINNEEEISFKWSENKQNIFTFYTKGSNTLKMHYFIESSLNKKALFIEDKQIHSLNTLMLTSESNKTKNYHLASNHIENNQQNFSMKLSIKDEKLIENNILEFQQIASNLEEGNYLILPSDKNVTTLNLIDKFTLVRGSFSIFRGELQGHTNNEILLDTLENNTSLLFLRLVL